jgi:hypothetical protein
MTFIDPTMSAALNVWGESISLLRTPPVSLAAVFTAPDSLRLYGGIQVDTIDAAAHVKSADIAGLSLQPGERVSVRGLPHHIVSVLEDDGAGSAILLRRLVA